MNMKSACNSDIGSIYNCLFDGLNCPVKETFHGNFITTNDADTRTQYTYKVTIKFQKNPKLFLYFKILVINMVKVNQKIST